MSTALQAYWTDFLVSLIAPVAVSCTGEPEQHPKEPPGGLGHSITADDMAAAGQLMKDFCERTLLPKLEERIARLNLIISNARKGFKNKLTRFWKGAAAESGPPQVRAAFWVR